MTAQFMSASNQSVNERIVKLQNQIAQIYLGFVAISSLIIGLGIFLFGQGSVLAFITTIGISLLVGGIFYLVRRRIYVRFIIQILLLILLLTSLISSEDLFVTSNLMLTIVIAALLGYRASFWLFAILVAGRIGMQIAIDVTAVMTTAPDPQAFVTTVTPIIVVSFVPLIVGWMVRTFALALQNIASNAQRSANLLETSSIIGQSMSQMLSVNDLLAQAVEIIRDRFGYYHVQIFLIDEDNRYAYLRAGTGDIGQQMLAQGHRLAVDAHSVIGRVAQVGEPIITRDTRRDPFHATNEMLAATRSELALPINDGPATIGALDVQSTQPGAFTDNEIQALQVIAGQLATAIRNARLFEAQERNVRENKRLFIESETNLREIQRLNRQLTKQAWSDYLNNERRISGVTLEGQTFKNIADWSERMIIAGQRRRPIAEAIDDKYIIAVPVELRGEVVGAVEIEVDKAEEQEEALEMVQSIAQRLAISLDNARLFEESQEATAQEQRLGEIVSQYQSAATVDDLLKITLEGLAESLGAEEAAIRLGKLPGTAQLDPHMPEANGKPGNNNGGSSA